jgi:transcriptional regulator with GAF, ATPase, and Fis domain
MVSPVVSAVLIQGKTGTGKEVIARAIHDASPRRKNRFVTLSCVAIPSMLLERELSGYEKGTFTGAVGQNAGRFQAADRGTLFLDEIGDLPLELQTKRLRTLQEKQVEKLGGGLRLSWPYECESLPRRIRTSVGWFRSGSSGPISIRDRTSHRVHRRPASGFR